MYGAGNVLSLYSPVTVSPSATCSLFPDDWKLVVKYAVPWKIPVASPVSVMVSLIPPESESDHTLVSNLSTAFGLRFMSGSTICNTP